MSELQTIDLVTSDKFMCIFLNQAHIKTNQGPECIIQMVTFLELVT